jgi:hypothetical protein
MFASPVATSNAKQHLGCRATWRQVVSVAASSAASALTAAALCGSRRKTFGSWTTCSELQQAFLSYGLGQGEKFPLG